MRALLAALSLTAAAPAQIDWYKATTPNGPSRRNTHAIASEPISGRVVLFGGILDNGPQFDDTWEWTGATWTQVQTPVHPSAREGHAMAPDGQGGVILFGGDQGGAETWRFASGQWTQLFPAANPPARRSHSMALVGSSILMFGGSTNDTWEWNGNNWIQRFPATSPPARWNPGLAFDPWRNRAVLCGGWNGTAMLADTWEWDATTWERIWPDHQPQVSSRTAFSPHLGRVIAYAGFNIVGSSPVVTGECWAWDGTDWTQLSLAQPNPGPRDSPIAWSHLSQGLLLYAGHSALGDDTWLTAPSAPPASYSPYGTGCIGPNGLTPALAAVPRQLPHPGTTSHVRVTNLPLAVTIPVFVVGFSDTWDPDGYPLPLDLGIIGWTGCTQFVADDILYWEITTSGQADLAIIVPTGTPLGFTFHVQSLVLYTPTGVALSNAVTGVVGY